jgi:hypothetical protein
VPYLSLLALALGIALARQDAASQEIPASPSPRPVPPGHAAIQRFQLQGAGSCASAACHNDPSRTGFQGREYALALERDPSDPRQRVKDRHADAYAVLFDPLAQQIERSFRSDPWARPETDTLCLKCHVFPTIDTQPVRLLDGLTQFRVEDGVSCESCHGPAERWLAAHFRGGWCEQSPAARASQGQADTRSVVGRVTVCVDCHVGAPGMDVNHDLIAAGHPRLNFEFASFHLRLHKHWDYAKDRDPAVDPRGRRDFEARAWLLGQVAAARASLLLLADRAESSANDPGRPWPEFAEYDCAACHHPVKAGAFGKPALGAGKVGRMPFNRWYTALLPDALSGFEGGPGPEIAKTLEDVRTAMESPRPDRKQIATQARRVAMLLEGLSEPPSVPIASLLQRILDHPKATPARPDDVAQRDFAVSALRRAEADLGLPGRRVEDLRGKGSR